MTSNVLKNVKVYLLSHAVARYCMIYFGNSSKIGICFRINHVLKNLMLKILKKYFQFMDYDNTFQKKDKNLGSLN